MYVQVRVFYGRSAFILPCVHVPYINTCVYVRMFHVCIVVVTLHVKLTSFSRSVCSTCSMCEWVVGGEIERKENWESTIGSYCSRRGAYTYMYMEQKWKRKWKYELIDFIYLYVGIVATHISAITRTYMQNGSKLKITYCRYKTTHTCVHTLPSSPL